MWTAGSDCQVEELNWTDEKAIQVSQLYNCPVYFFAPKKYLGDQRFVYNQEIIFTLQIQRSYSGGGWASK